MPKTPSTISSRLSVSSPYLGPLSPRPSISHSTSGPTDAPVGLPAGVTQIQQITPPPSRGVLSNTSVPPSPTPDSSIKTGLKTKLEQENAAESDVDAHLETSHTGEFEAHDTMDRHDLMQTVQHWLTNQQIKKFVVDLVSRHNDLKSSNGDMKAHIVRLEKMVVAGFEENSRQHEMNRQLIKNGMQTILNQTYELHEYPIPRLFIVLPQMNTSPMNPFASKFRLYFLCECGEHTKSTNSKISHEIHLARHGGYEISRPNEFFRKYGSHILTILQMLKFGISVAGIAVPAISHLIRENVDKAASNLKVLIGNIQSGMDQAIGYLREMTTDKGVVDEHSEQMRLSKALEGADLRLLETFLNGRDKEKVWGNLYRIVTPEGHVKWVCADHYRSNYQGKASTAFRATIESLGGSIDENMGRVNVKLPSKSHARKFYQELEQAKPVYELNIELDWVTSRGDFKRLRDALLQTNVVILNITLKDLDGPITDILRRRQRYDPIFDIMRHPSVQSFATNGPRKFVKRSSLQSRKVDFPNLRHLNIDVAHLRNNVSELKILVTKAPNLSSLTFKKDHGDFLQVYIAIAEHQTYTVSFPDQPLHILPPEDSPPQSPTDLKDMSDLLTVLGGRIEIVNLSKAGLDDSTVAGFAKATENGSRLKELTLGKAERDLSEQCIKVLASIVARSELRKLAIHMESEEERIHILESIQWDHLCELEISMERKRMEMPVMRALIEGAIKMKGRMGLEEFRLYSERDGPLKMPRDGLLEAFLSSTSLKTLELDVAMVHGQMVSLLQSVDLSRMQKLCLRTNNLASARVDDILKVLDVVNRATELRCIRLSQADITEDQVERMKEKNIELSRFF